MVTLLFALLAGILTVAAPCTLPVLPVLFGASIGQTSKARPVFMALGFVASFTIVATVFRAITRIVGIDPDRLRTVAVGLLFIFGVLMLWPRPFEWLGGRAGDLLDRVYRIPIRAQNRNIGGFVLGTTLGLVWTPCAGPVLASILTVIATAPHIEWAALLLIVYAVGAAMPMLAIAYGGQFVTTRVRGHRPCLALSAAGLWRGDHCLRGSNVSAIRHAHHRMVFRVLSKRLTRPVRGEIHEYSIESRCDCVGDRLSAGIGAGELCQRGKGPRSAYLCRGSKRRPKLCRCQQLAQLRPTEHY